ncbi:MAG: DUF1015 domain-containing protein [Oscillospiraceae bacterium]|nr:DUF1015 domain-containing protein [Oscillospiraceae bacterium]
MAVVKPFKALRFNFEKAGTPETVCCPPFDVIPDPSEWTDKSPYNAILLEGGKRLGTKDPYGDAKKTLESWLAEGILTEDAEPAFYIYEVDFTVQDGSAKTLRGFVGLLELTPFSEGTVLPHEVTLAKDREDRLRLMTETNCQFSSIYGLYDDPEGKIAGLLRPAPDSAPDCSFTMPDGLTHTLRTVSDPGVCAALSQAMSNQKITIADGHHRYGTLLHLRETTGKPQHAMIFLTAMNDPGVDVWATHRVVTGMNWYGEETLRKLLEEKYTVTEGGHPDDGTFVWITESGKYTLTPKTPWTARSSVAALHDDILEPLLGIGAENMAKGKNLTYTRVAGEAEKLVQSGEAQCAFLLPKFTMGELRDTVLAGELMPQKSTYFYPKIITGLFMRRF